MMQYVRAYPARFEKFQEYVENEKIKAKCLLSLNVPTRWNLTYLMLDCALKFVRAFDRLGVEDGHYKLYFCEVDGNGKKTIGPANYLDWENVETFVKFLGIFYEATLRFSGSLFVTSNTCFHELISIEDQSQQLCSVDEDPLFRGMVIEMKNIYDKYRGIIDNINLMLFFVVVLDLRYRLQYVKFWFKKWYGKDKGDAMSFRIQDALKRLYMERVGQNRASSSSGSGNSASLSKDSRPSVGNASNTVEALICTQNWLKDAKKKRPIKLRE